MAQLEVLTQARSRRLPTRLRVR